MPKAYLYAEIVVTNPDEYEKYRQQVPATIAQYGGTYRVRGGDPEVLEGDGYPGVRRASSSSKAASAYCNGTTRRNMRRCGRSAFVQRRATWW